MLHKIVTVTLAKYFTTRLIFVFKVHLEIIVKFKNVLFLKCCFSFSLCCNDFTLRLKNRPKTDSKQSNKKEIVQLTLTASQDFYCVSFYCTCIWETISPSTVHMVTLDRSYFQGLHIPRLRLPNVSDFLLFSNLVLYTVYSPTLLSGYTS